MLLDGSLCVEAQPGRAVAYGFEKDVEHLEVYVLVSPSGGVCSLRITCSREIRIHLIVHRSLLADTHRELIYESVEHLIEPFRTQSCLPGKRLWTGLP